MPRADFDIVTGAFGYTGKYIARLLLRHGRRVMTLTGHPTRPHLSETQIEALPFNFDHPEVLAHSLEGAGALINTYWIRFAYGHTTYDKAVASAGSAEGRRRDSDSNQWTANSTAQRQTNTIYSLCRKFERTDWLWFGGVP